MSQPETAQVAAALTASMLGDFVETHGDENAARMLAEMQPEGQLVEAPQPVVSSPAPAADAAPVVQNSPDPDDAAANAAIEAVVAATDAFDFTPKLDDDYRALLEEPDFEEEAAAEVAAEVEERGYDDTFDTDAAKKIRELEKRNAWLTEQNVKANKSKWVAEAERSFPLLGTYAADELRQIEASSRRGFAREAAKLNERYSKVLGPALQEVANLKAQAKAEALVEARSEAARQWGLPVVEASGAPAAIDETQRKLKEAREQGASLEERLKILGGVK
jgi:hypothetical protein